MTTVPALWTKHRPLAHTLARGYHIPGAEAQDVHQEALIGLWIASRNWNPERGSFTNFARIVIRGRLNEVLTAALRKKHAFITNASRDDIELAPGPDLERVVIERERLQRIIASIHNLPPKERAAIKRIVNGLPCTNKAEDNHRQQARRKLRNAA